MNIKKQNEFVEKEFNLLVPFQIKDMGEDDESLTIEGFANWYGDNVEEDGEGVACDLAGEAVVPTGIDLSVYKGNPQILWQHDRCCSIGKANKVVRKKQGLFVNATIYKSAMEEADWFRVKTGLVTKFSIGFRTMAGEYKEVSGKNIFFITKSLLMEISIVTIPCSSESGFSIIKSLADGSFTASSHSEPQPDPTEEVIPSEKEDTMKITLKELLSVEEVEHFKALGLDAELELEKEVSTKTYIDNAISKAVADLREEIAKLAPPTVETNEEPEETKAEAEAEVKESEVEPEDETKSEPEETVEEVIDFGGVKSALDQLKAILAEEK